MSVYNKFFAISAVLVAGAAGCSNTNGEIDDVAAGLELDSLDETQLTNAQACTSEEVAVGCSGSWTANATAPNVQNSGTWNTDVRLKSTVTGTGSRKVGSCLLNQAMVADAPVGCSSESQCTTYAPTGGEAYCLAVNGTGGKTCFFRGAATTYCNGTPAGAGMVSAATASAAGNWVHAFANTQYGVAYYWDGASLNYTAKWMTYTCFAAQNCSASTLRTATYAAPF